MAIRCPELMAASSGRKARRVTLRAIRLRITICTSAGGERTAKRSMDAGNFGDVDACARSFALSSDLECRLRLLEEQPQGRVSLQGVVL